MTTAQVYSNNNQFQHCVQGLQVALHAASWLRACSLAGVPLSFLGRVQRRQTRSRRRVLQPDTGSNYVADGIRLPGPVGSCCLLGPGLQGLTVDSLAGNPVKLFKSWDHNIQNHLACMRNGANVHKLVANVNIFSEHNKSIKTSKIKKGGKNNQDGFENVPWCRIVVDWSFPVSGWPKT